jgi:hypothetical protein
MMQQQDSPLEWCMYLAKTQPQAAQRPLDALFRLLFIAAGKAVETNRTSGTHSFDLEFLRGLDGLDGLLDGNLTFEYSPNFFFFFRRPSASILASNTGDAIFCCFQPYIWCH